MKVPAPLQNTAERFNRMSLRERVMVFAALLGLVIVSGDAFLLQPIARKERALTSEIEQLNMQMTSAAHAVDDAPDPTTLAHDKQRTLQASLNAVNAELASTAAGLIAPEHITAMLHEVLRRQRGVRLVSLHNEPVRSLLPQVEPAAGEMTPSAPAGPFSHPVVLIVEGSYFDVLEYLRELEAMSFRVYWNRLDLTTLEYPRNRVRIELSTLSMDHAWLGV